MSASDSIPTDQQKQFELPLEGSSFITEVAWASSPLFRAKLLARIAMHRQKDAVQVNLRSDGNP